MVHVGQVIRERRNDLGLTQKALANRTGLEQTYISKVEIGKIRRPEREMLDLFALGLEMPADQLYLAVFGKRRKAVQSGDEQHYRTIGRVPADTVRWTAMQDEYEGRDVDIPTSWLVDATHPIFAVDVSGDCLTELNIADGDIVVCEEYHGQTIRDGKVVLVMVDGECTLKAWFQVDARTVELRNGKGVVIRTLPARGGFEILGVVIKVIGDR